ncbi:lipopolysaccharide assembly protein LapB [Fibrobacter sp. UWB12]|nr:tetratricopeptide repeat protein [Fibrobacter sp. UWB12]SIN97722.1 Tetratricopeptide repeat-containing protein [Fibrobacter sp. UWB11]
MFFIKKHIFLSVLCFLLFLPLNVFAADDFFFKANELYDQGRYKESVKYYRAAIDDGRYEPFAWFNLGNALVQLGKKEVAMVAYKRTVELLPDFVKAWMLLGDLYYLAESPSDAIVAYNRAIELGTETDHIHFALAECYMKGSDWTLAQKHFERALALNPDRMDAWYGLAEVYEKLGDYEYAVKTLKNALQMTATAGADVHYTLSYYYRSMDSTRLALNEMENGIMMDPENVSARRYLAQMYVKNESPWMAIFTLEEGLRHKKGIADLNLDLGQIYFTQKRYDEAFECYMKAWRAGNSQGRIGAENVGHIFSNAGDTEKAEALYARIRDKK